MYVLFAIMIVIFSLIRIAKNNTCYGLGENNHYSLVRRSNIISAQGPLTDFVCHRPVNHACRGSLRSYHYFYLQAIIIFSC